MKAVVQRVSRASVTVDGEVIGEIAYGALILLGVLRGDTSQEALWMAQKIASLRFFEDASGLMNLSLVDLHGRGTPCGVLVVSQFTLAADGKKGRRPSFDQAAAPAEARPLYTAFCEALREAGLTVAQGRFGAAMQVELVNEGPATFVLERPNTND